MTSTTIPLARGEVGKVGVPVSHLGDMETRCRGIPLDRMNTSMTINATAAWLFALYVARADKHGVTRGELSGTIQNDIVKEYLSRGTYIFPPSPSLKLITDTIAFTGRRDAEMEPGQRLPLSLAGSRRDAGAGDRLRPGHGDRRSSTTVKAVGRVAPKDFDAGRRPHQLFRQRRHPLRHRDLQDARLRRTVGRDRRNATASTDPKLRRFRYGVQVNSLGLTEQQPENNVYRILLEMLAVVLSKNARARAVQLPAWNEALGLPRPWDQQWSLRLQQIVAIGDGPAGIRRHLRRQPRDRRQGRRIEGRRARGHGRIETLGGAAVAVESGYMKQALVARTPAALPISRAATSR